MSTSTPMEMNEGFRGTCRTCGQSVALIDGVAEFHPSSQTQKGYCSGSGLKVVQ